MRWNAAIPSGAQAQVFHANAEVLLVEDSQHQLFAQQRRHAGDAQVNLAALGDDAHAAFLRQPFFSDIHLADDFDSRHDRRVHSCRRLHQIAKYAVDSVADARALFVRLDVDVAGLVTHGREQRDVHQIDDRAARDHLVQFGQRPFVHCFALDHFHLRISKRGEERVHRYIAGCVFLEKLADVRVQRQYRPDVATGKLLQAIDRRQRLWLGHRDRQRVPNLEHRDDAEPLGLFDADQF